MFVKNKTPYAVALPRGHFLGRISIAAIVATVTHRWTTSGLQPWSGERVPLATDPPTSADRALWEGASVTVAGTIQGPGRVPLATSVALRCGELSKTITVTGDRRWVRNAGKLIASTPAPWDRMPLSWELAFGGTVEMAPGPIGPEKLPHPGGRFPHPVNPGGKGACLDETTAEGQPLPNIESPEDPMKHPTDQPRPAGLAPCPDLPALRAPRSVTPEGARDPKQLLHMMLRAAHSGPGDQIVPRVLPGTPFEVTALVGGPVRFQVPRCPLQVSVRKGKSHTAVAPLLRAVHLSGDDGAVLVTYAHPFFYESAPSWVDVLAA